MVYNKIYDVIGDDYSTFGTIKFIYTYPAVYII